MVQDFFAGMGRDGGSGRDRRTLLGLGAGRLAIIGIAVGRVAVAAMGSQGSCCASQQGSHRDTQGR